MSTLSKIGLTVLTDEPLGSLDPLWCRVYSPSRAMEAGRVSAHRSSGMLQNASNALRTKDLYDLCNRWKTAATTTCLVSGRY